MLYTLVKHPDEALSFVLDFSRDTPPTSARDTVWPQGNLLASGESLTGAPTITLRRDDGQASDLAVVSSSVAGSQILLKLSGGTDGVLYFITADASSTTSQTRTGEGRLAVSMTLSLP